MAKIELSDISSGYNLSKVNENFQKIEDALNDEVLYRDNPVGEDNALQTNIDANNKRILNLPDPVSASEPIRKQEWDQTVGLAEQYRDEAEGFKDETEDLRDDVIDLLDQLSPVNYRGDYNTGILYQKYDAVFDEAEVLSSPGAWYIATQSFTSTDIASDVASGYLQVYRDKSVIYFDSLVDVQGMTFTEGQQLSIAEYRDGVQGGLFVWSTGVHDGGLFIDTSVAQPVDWGSESEKATWFAYTGLTVSGLKRIKYSNITAELYGFKYGEADDTKTLEALFRNDSVDLLDGNHTYIKSSELGASVTLPKVIKGDGWKLNCSGAVSFGLADESNHAGGTITSDDTFTINPLTPRSSAASSNMLITNVEDITKYKCHVDFEYSANTDGSTRGEGFIRITSTVACDLDIKSKQSGCVIGTWINPEGGKIHGSIKFSNCETGLLKRSGMSEDLDLELVNTPAQMSNFRNTSDTVPSVNGKDTILSEASAVKTPETNLRLRSSYAIERGAYLQRAGKGKITSWSYGCDGGKCTDDSEGLEIHSYTTLVSDGSTEQRYSWQVYGGVNGACKDIDIWPVLHNLTGVTGNKETCPVLGLCENISIHEPYGYDVGNGLLLIQDISGVFAPQIDGLTMIGGRCEGPDGTTSANGAITVLFGSAGSGQYVRNLTIDGTSSQPSSDGQDTFNFREVTESTNVLNVSVDGVKDSQEYGQHVVFIDCENVTHDSDVLFGGNRGFSKVKPSAIRRTDLAVNTTVNHIIGTFSDATPYPAIVEIEILARHSSQPSGNYIDYKSTLLVGSSTATAINLVDRSNLASSQTVSISYDATTKEVTLSHTSSSALGFDDATFYSRVMSNRDLV